MRSCAHGPNTTGVLLLLLLLCFSLFPERIVRGSKGHDSSGVTTLGCCASFGSGQVVRMSASIIVKTVFYSIGGRLALVAVSVVENINAKACS